MNKILKRLPSNMPNKSPHQVSTKDEEEDTKNKRNPLFPKGIRRHNRYLSDFETHQVEIATGHHSERLSKIRVFDLSLININCLGARGIYKNILPLIHFPHLVDAAKIAINSACERFDRGDTGQNVSITIRNFRQICSWMIQQGIYRLDDLKIDHIQQLTENLASDSWWNVLHYNSSFEALLLRIKHSPENAHSFSQSSNGKGASLRISALEREIGLPLSGSHIPLHVRQAISKAIGDKRPVISGTKTPIPSAVELKHAMTTLSSIAMQPEPFDSIRFFPFHSVHKEAQSLLDAAKKKKLASEGGISNLQASTPPGQTPNIGTAEYARLFEELTKWVIDYGPEVCDLLEIAQDDILGMPASGRKDRLTAMRRRIVQEHQKRVETGRLPGPPIEGQRGKNSMTSLVKLTMTAAASLIAANHARRSNELVGFGKPYGLYVGCLQTLREFPPAYQLDAYVEKGIQDYRSFPANTLVRDAINLLERMYCLFQPEKLSRPPYSNPRENSRALKLLKYKEFNSRGFASKAVSFKPRPYFNQLLKRAGVEASVWHGQQSPFRRMFTTLFIRRYDLPEYPAVQAQLGHLNLATTIPYQTDLVARDVGASIQELHGREVVASEEASVLTALAQSRAEYLTDGVMRLLDGKFTGGKFAPLVLALVKRLSALAEFRELTLQRKAERVSSTLLKRRYDPDPMSHTACMAGSARHTKTASNCFRDGTLHREHASAESCAGCIHSWNNESYLKLLEVDKNHCQLAAKDPSNDDTTRKAYAEAVEALTLLLESERKLALTTKEKVETLVKSWQVLAAPTKGGT